MFGFGKRPVEKLNFIIAGAQKSGTTALNYYLKRHPQIGARILSDLKTERAQAQVDQRRTTANFADAIAGGAFDEAKAGDGAQQRVKSAERLKDAVVKALREIHAVNADRWCAEAARTS